MIVRVLQITYFNPTNFNHFHYTEFVPEWKYTLHVLPYSSTPNFNRYLTGANNVYTSWAHKYCGECWCFPAVMKGEVKGWTIGHLFPAQAPQRQVIDFIYRTMPLMKGGINHRFNQPECFYQIYFLSTAHEESWRVRNLFWYKIKILC